MPLPQLAVTDERPDEANAGGAGDAARLRERFARAIDLWAEHGDAAAELVCGDAPELLPVVRRRLRMLDGLGLLARDEPADRADAPLPDRLGDFRLEQRLAGGGMGVVYRAFQESVGREVALKVIHPDQLFLPRARDRFRREIEALARLRHPGIVTIHACGEEGGVPFFAMELVEGMTLQELLVALRDVPAADVTPARVWTLLQQRRREAPAVAPPNGWPRTWAAFCVRVVGEVAAAMAHAHAHGILHRDLKPSNVMLTVDGRACVVDFGLAVDGAGSSTMTRAGSLLGSLPYMAPEQLDGRHGEVDERSDVYSLGVTLYELLTRRAAFPQTSIADLRDCVHGGRYVPIRHVDRAIPRDVETICAAAMEPVPARRYASMAALHADTERHLAGAPILARPQPWPRRAWLRVRRRPGAAAVAVCLLLALVAWPFARAWVDAEAGDRSAQATQRARGYFLDIGRTFDGLLERIEREHAHRWPDTAALRRELGRSFARLAGIEHVLGNTVGAEAAFRHAIDYLDVLRVEFPDDHDLLRQQAESLQGLGDLLDTLGRDDEQLACIERTLQLAEELAERVPGGTEAEVLRLDALARLGTVHCENGRGEAGLAAFAAALDGGERFVAAHANDPWVGEIWGVLQADYGNYLRRFGEPARAEQVLRRARTWQLAALAREPDSRSQQRALARIHNSLAAVCSAAGDDTGAVAELERAVVLLEELAAVYPSQWARGVELATTCNNLALVLEQVGRSADAQAARTRSLDVLEALVGRHADVPLLRARYAVTLHNAADARFEDGDFDGALALLQQARPHHAAARAAQPDNLFAVQADRTARWLTALTQVRLGELAAATAELEALLAEPEAEAGEWQRAAGYLASGAGTVGEAGAADSERAALDVLARRVVAWLRRAHELGALDAERLADPDVYGALVAQPDFRALVEELRRRR